MSTFFSSIFSLTALWYVLIGLYTTICVALILVIMVQKGKGAGFAGAFGLGAGSETVFGPRGSQTLPVRLTHIGAGLFMLLAFLLSALAGHVGQGSAPEEVVADGAIAGEDMQELEKLGLGDQAGETPAAPATETPAPAPEAPAATPEAPAAEAPAAAPEAPAAPATETPAPEAPAAPAPEAPAEGGAS